jgi:excisionase family DNA binding protein
MARLADAPTKEDLTAALQLVLDNSIDVTAAATRTGRAYTTLRRRIAEGRVPAFRFGRDMRMWLADVEALRAGEFL